MSQGFFKEDVLFTQRLLKGSGFYQGKLDGVWGPKTDAAVALFEERFRTLRSTLGEFDLRTEGNLQTLHPKAQEAARRLLARVRGAGVDARILSGTRTYAQQNELFRIGRFGDTRRKVTNARGGQSNHNFGIAWDIGLFAGGKYLQELKPYDRAAGLGLVAGDGLEWGGSWKSLKDRPHYQLATGLPIAAVRERFERGEAVV
jgi:peptidoglycan L-alanyl-D-glutamate endopeptidase CwlK